MTVFGTRPHAAPPGPSGFTLIELLVVMAVIGLLAIIAAPSYTAYVQRSRIVDATTRLADFRVRMEQFFMDNRRYTDPAGSSTCGVPVPPFTGQESFDLKCVATDDNHYDATAVGRSDRNMQAFTYSIDQNGRKRTKATPWNGITSDSCWVTRQDGSCG